jgi:hypothetical protein
MAIHCTNEVLVCKSTCNICYYVYDHTPARPYADLTMNIFWYQLQNLVFKIYLVRVINSNPKSQLAFESLGVDRLWKRQ